MRELFGREIAVTVDTIEVIGHRVAFECEKSLKSEPNTCSLKIWNLSESQRSQLEELRPKVKKGQLATKGIPTKIEAGYDGALSQIWLGDLRTCDSTREGPDWVTSLESGDADKAFANARMHVSYGPKTPVDTALRAMVRALGIGEGNVSKVVAQLKVGSAKLFPHGYTASGSVARQLTDFARSADLEWSIQDGTLQFLDRGKALATEAIELSPDTGLVGSPTVDNDGIATIKMLMHPDVRPGTLIVLKSSRIKGNYRIEKGVWSGDNFGGDFYITAQASRY